MDRPQLWKSRVRLAQQTAARAFVLEEAWQLCRGLACKCLVAAGASVEAFHDRAAHEPFPCGKCQKVFRTQQAWSVHAFKTHGRVKQSRTLVEHVSCPICLRVYATNVQLCRHVDHSRSCRNEMIARGFRCAPQPGQGSKHADLGHDVSLPGIGPSRQAVTMDDTVVADFRDTETWQLLLTELTTNGTATACELLGVYRSILCHECWSLPELRGLAKQWLQFVQEGAEDCSVTCFVFHQNVSTWVVNNVCAEWLCPEVSDGRIYIATFRKSLECLAPLDFAEVCPVCADDVFLDRGFLLCDKPQIAALVREGGTPARVLALQEALVASDWCQTVASAVRQGINGLYVLCLQGVECFEVVPRRPLNYKLFERHREQARLIQDAALLAIQLWAKGVGFAAIFPYLDPPLASVLRRLPGLHVLCHSNRVLFHNVKEAFVPQTLFHLATN